MDEVHIRDADLSDRKAVSLLLARASLVDLDDQAQFGSQYAVAFVSSASIIGVAGVEVYGTDALLRSVAVEEDQRGLGIGSKLAKDRMRWAKERGIKRLYLLTTTAGKYWRRLGFGAIDRKAAPAGVRGSHEWSSACPTSATAMAVDL